MKPKDLKVPFKWSERRVLWDEIENILYLPNRTERKNFAAPIKNLFGSFSKVYLEYCSGNGEWICNKAFENPEILWVAVEKKFQRVQKIWSKSKNLDLKNLFIVCGEAEEATEHYFFKNAVSRVYINFPDPWPKKKHAKNRLIQTDFIQQLDRILKNDAEVYFLTDDQSYSSQAIHVFLEDCSPFSSSIEPPYYLQDVGDYGSSYFKSLWEEKKREFYFSKFHKKCKYKKEQNPQESTPIL